MKIESLQSGDLRIWMTDHELERWGLQPCDLYRATSAADRAVRRLLGVARERAKFHSSGTVRVEVLPIQGGVVLVLSAVKPLAEAPAACLYGLQSAEEVLDVGQRLFRFRGLRLPYASLYYDGERFYLVVYPLLGEARRVTRLLREYADTSKADAATVAYLEEHARPLAVGDALHRLVTAYGSRLPELPDPQN